jgi:hypothetical protein
VFEADRKPAAVQRPPVKQEVKAEVVTPESPSNEAILEATDETVNNHNEYSVEDDATVETPVRYIAEWFHLEALKQRKRKGDA